MTISTGQSHEFDYVEERSCIRAQCNCLCGTGACRCCCRGCPPMKESTLTRIIYVTFLMIGVFLMAVFMSREVQEEVKNLFSDKALCKWLGARIGTPCLDKLGYLVVYRIGLAISLFHLVLMFSTCGVKTSKECRAGFHNGLWLYKIMLLVILTFAVFLIPDKQHYFVTAWMYVAMTGGASFIVIQLVLLVFMVHKWTDKIQKKVNDGGSRLMWFAFFGPGVSLILFGLSAAGIALLYIYFASEDGCYRNQWFIFINAGACFVVSFIAAIRKNSKPFGLRLLHGSLITLYVTYLTWLAISSAPRRFQRFSKPTSFLLGDFRGRIPHPSYQEFYCGPNGDEESFSDLVIPYVSFVVTVLTVVYGSIGISERDQCRALELPGCPNPPPSDGILDHDRDDTGGQIVIRNEKRGLVYSYALFHAMMTLACLLMMMHLTQWHTPTRAALHNFGRSWSAVWIKICSSWICLAIYFITVLFPSVLPSVLPGGGEKTFMSVVEMNGYAIESEDESDISEEAVPLTVIKRPTMLVAHQETTV